MNILLSNITSQVIIGNQIKIYVDFDCVLYNLQDQAIIRAKEVYGLILTRQDINSWTFFNDYPKVIDVYTQWELYSKGSVFDGAIEFMEKLYHMFGKENVYILTNSHKSFIKEKDEMIMRVFNTTNIIHAEFKYLYTHNNILIDDHITNIELHSKHNNGLGLLFDRKGEYGWNKDNIEDRYESVRRVTSYEDILNVLSNIDLN